MGVYSMLHRELSSRIRQLDHRAVVLPLRARWQTVCVRAKAVRQQQLPLDACGKIGQSWPVGVGFRRDEAPGWRFLRRLDSLQVDAQPVWDGHALSGFRPQLEPAPGQAGASAFAAPPVQMSCQ